MIDDRIRVLRIIARINVGGPALHTAALSWLDPERFQTLVVHGSLARGEDDMSDLLDGVPAEVSVVPELGRTLRPWHDTVALTKLLRLMMRYRPHIIHTHTAKAGALGRVAATMFRRLAWGHTCRVLHTFHGHVFHGYFSPMKSWAALMTERRLAGVSDRIITLSEQLKTELVSRFRIAPAEKVVVVPLGLDLEPFSRAPRDGQFRTSLGIGTDTFVIACVGRLVPIKNHRLLLQTARLLRASGHDNFVVLIVGGGELQEYLEQEAIALDVAQHVRFLGWRRDLPALYGGTDMAVLTSRNEGTPVSLIEAMAAGLPVVSTNVGGVPDVVQDQKTGYLVSPGDARGLAQAIGSLDGNPDRRRALGEAGRKRALELFTRERLLSRIASLYESLLAPPPEVVQADR